MVGTPSETESANGEGRVVSQAQSDPLTVKSMLGADHFKIALLSLAQWIARTTPHVSRLEDDGGCGEVCNGGDGGNGGNGDM